MIATCARPWVHRNKGTKSPTELCGIVAIAWFQVFLHSPKLVLFLVSGFGGDVSAHLWLQFCEERRSENDRFPYSLSLEGGILILLDIFHSET